MKISNPKKIVISRTDSIGDVALTLPLAGILREKYPEATIIFLGNTYTKPIIECSNFIDKVWSWAELKTKENQAQINWIKSQNIDIFIHVFPRRELARLAQKAKIPHRIGTSHRLFHILTCNHRVNFTRKNSPLHEAQLNVKLLSPLGVKKSYSLKQLTQFAGFQNLPHKSNQFTDLLKSNQFNIVLHPKSKGSALEWGIDKFIELSKILDSNQFNVYFTGTEEESTFFRTKLPKQANIIDLSGKMTLNELIVFIRASDCLIAASTGPLHIAGLSNINTIGLFTSRKPLHYGRWQPLGDQVQIIEEKTISERNENLNISVDQVKTVIEKLV